MKRNLVMFAVFVAAGGSCCLTGCVGSSDRPASVEQKGNPEATRVCWDKCSEIVRKQGEVLNEMWFKDFRPGDVSQVYQDTANQLKAVPVFQVDVRVVRHVNLAISGMRKIGGILEAQGSAKLRDEFLPSEISVFGLIVIRRAPTGAAAIIHQTLLSVENELRASEKAVSDQVRSMYGIELRPWPW